MIKVRGKWGAIYVGQEAFVPDAQIMGRVTGFDQVAGENQTMAFPHITILPYTQTQPQTYNPNSVMLVPPGGGKPYPARVSPPDPPMRKLSKSLREPEPKHNGVLINGAFLPQSR